MVVLIHPGVAVNPRTNAIHLKRPSAAEQAWLTIRVGQGGSLDQLEVIAAELRKLASAGHELAELLPPYGQFRSNDALNAVGFVPDVRVVALPTAVQRQFVERLAAIQPVREPAVSSWESDLALLGAAPAAPVPAAAPKTARATKAKAAAAAPVPAAADMDIPF